MTLQRRMRGDKGQTAIALAGSVTLIVGFIGLGLASVAGTRTALERTDTTERIVRQAESYAEPEILHILNSLSTNPDILNSLSTNPDILNSLSTNPDTGGSVDPATACARNQNPSPTPNEELTNCLETEAKTHFPKTWKTLPGNSDCTATGDSWCWRIVEKVDYQLKPILLAGDSSTEPYTACVQQGGAAGSGRACVREIRLTVQAAPGYCLNPSSGSTRELREECDAATSSTLSYRSAGLLSYLLWLEQGKGMPFTDEEHEKRTDDLRMWLGKGGELSTDENALLEPSLPFVTGEIFNGRVYVGGQPIYCGMPAFNGDIESPMGWGLSDCKNDAVKPTGSLIQLPVKRVVSLDGFDAAKRQAEASGTTSLPPTEADADCDAIAYISEDDAVSLSGRQKVGAVVAYGDIVITGDLDSCDGRPLVIASETGSIILALTEPKNLVIWNNVVLIAPKGALISRSWNESCANDDKVCPDLKINGVLALRNLGVTGRVNPNSGKAEAGHDLVLTYPQGFSLKTPVWLPGLSGERWQPLQ